MASAAWKTDPNGKFC